MKIIKTNETKCDPIRTNILSNPKKKEKKIKIMFVKCQVYIRFVQHNKHLDIPVLISNVNENILNWKFLVFFFWLSNCIRSLMKIYFDEGIGT